MSLSDDMKPDVARIQECFQAQQRMSLELRKEPLSARKSRLKKLRDWIADNRAAIQRVVYDDLGKPFLEVDATEVFPALNEIAHALTNLPTWVKPRKIDAPITMFGTRARVGYEPRGVCLIIAPWNYPFNLCIGPLIAAIAAGNCAVLKPSEITANTSALIKKMCDEVFEPGVVSAFEGDADVSQFLLSLPFDHIFFTGSPAIGKLVMKAASDHLASVTLELGGKSPAIVTANARVKEAAKRIAVPKFINAGQSCLAPDYVLAHESIASKLIDELVAQVSERFGEGRPMEESASYARIANDRHFARVEEILDDALSNGAVLHTGGERNRTTRFIHPVVLSNISMGARIMEEEIFGPLLPLLTYTSLDEAIAIINSKPKPLAVYIFGTDKGEQRRILQETSSGAVCINDSAVHFLHHNIPFGGVNTSGMGRAHGYHGFVAFSNEKPVLVQKHGFTSFEPFFPPYTKTKKKLMDILLKMI